MTTITMGVQDNAGPIVPVAFGPTTGLETIFPNGVSGGVLNAITFDGSYELAANNVSNLIPDTVNIYASFQGIIGPSGDITIPSILQTDEYAAPGWTISQQVFLCDTLFCTSDLVGTATQTGLATLTPTFFGVVGSPFGITLQLQFVSNGITAGDYGAAIVITPTSVPVVPIPAPVVGNIGLPILLALLMWSLRWVYQRSVKNTQS